MQLLSNKEISRVYGKGITYLSNIAYNKFIKDSYGVQYKNTSADNRLLMLLFALDSWNNGRTAKNWLKVQQMTAILDQIAYTHRDNLSSSCSTNFNNPMLQIPTDGSIILSYVNGVISSNLVVSTSGGNGLSIISNTPTNSGGSTVVPSPTGKIYLTGDNFAAGTNIYHNTSLAGIHTISVWHRGLGFLLYNYNNPSDPNNEYSMLSDGGIEITIPGFDVHDGDNFLYIMY